MLLVLSLDSVSEPLMQKMCAEGRLPAIDSIRKAGLSCDIDQEVEGAVYTTMQTGQRLADHGIYFPVQWSAEHQTSLPSNGQQGRVLRRDSVFSRAAERGLRALVLDPPETEPHDVAHSVLVSGVAFEARILLHRWSRPRSILRTVERSPRINEVFGVPNAPYLLHTARGLCEAPERLVKAWRQLTSQGEFDLVWVTMAAAHQAGHILFDETAWPADLDQSAQRELRGSLERVYERVDAAVGDFLESLPPGADVLMLSAKGMAANASRSDLLSRMIDRILGQETRDGRAQATPLRLLRSRLPLTWRARCAELLPPSVVMALMGRLETMGRDWRRTRAFAPPCDACGFVRFNVAGRERLGTVPESAVRALVEELTSGLASFNDIGGDADGGPAIQKIRTAAEYAGEGRGSDRLPDLVVDWAPGRANLIRGVRSERFGLIERQGAGTGRSGNHGAGSVMTLGNGGGARRAKAGRVRLEDVAPSILSLLGVAPTGLPGTPAFE